MATWGLGFLAAAAPPGVRGEPVSLSSRGAAGPARGVDLEVVGSSYETGEDGGRTRPIHSVVLGDPRAAEDRAYGWSHRFGMYALDATLWTRVWPESSARWRQTSLRRPATAAEIATFADTPEAFKVETLGGVDLLPRPFRELDEIDLARVEYIVSYWRGGSRALLRIGVAPHDADAMVRQMRGLMEARQ
jgi:hypothetical protein